MEWQLFLNFIEVARLDQVPLGKGALFTAAGKNVALFNVDGKIFALDDTCPHAGGSLGMGKLHGRIVTCPKHSMKFDVTNGCFLGSSESGVASYRVKVVDGKIMVALS